MLIHRSPAFTAIYNEIRNSDRNRVLELGPMNHGCFALFSELSCKIQVENLASFVRDHFKSGGDPTTIDIDQYLVDYDQEDKFDVILAWDLFNYLQLSEIKKLFEKLRPHCKPNTLVYMLRYVEKSIPHEPREFYVKDKYLLETSEPEVSERMLPSYSTIQLLSAMSGYFMQDTLVGQMGMLPGITEHVLRYSPSFESKHLISKSESARKPAVSAVEQDNKTRLHKSPSIAEVLSLLQCDSDTTVLELGSSSNRSEDLVVKKAGAYYRADIFSLIERSRAKNSDQLNMSVFDYEISRKFDVILAWDIFEYCSPTQIVQLNNALASVSHKNTFLLSYSYTGKSCPERPSKFEVLDGNSVYITPGGRTVAKKDSITGAALLRLLSNFNMDKTYAYRPGMDREILEYIFNYRETSMAGARPRVKESS